MPLAMKSWIRDYIQLQKQALESIDTARVARMGAVLREALEMDRQIFVFGNGGSAANASHFATDLGKGASDALGRRFRILSLNDNSSWMTALGNDYGYERIFADQLRTLARPGDLAIALSVSGDSPNLVAALDWARKNRMRTFALVGANRGRISTLASEVIPIDSMHYGRVEDAHMGICHMLCYAFIEGAETPVP